MVCRDRSNRLQDNNTATIPNRCFARVNRFTQRRWLGWRRLCSRCLHSVCDFRSHLGRGASRAGVSLALRICLWSVLWGGSGRWHARAGDHRTSQILKNAIEWKRQCHASPLTAPSGAARARMDRSLFRLSPMASPTRLIASWGRSSALLRRSHIARRHREVTAASRAHTAVLGPPAYLVGP